MNVNGLLTKRWLSHLESNQNSGYQKPVCSRYTMGQAELRILYHISFIRRPVRVHLTRRAVYSAMPVCLPACGLLRRNGARPARNGRFARPCDRSPYTYMSSGRSPVRLVSFSRVPLRWRRRSKPRMAPSGVRRGARGLGLSPAPCTAAPVVFTAIRAAMLRRRIHLLALRRVSPRIRRTASPHVAQFGTRHLVPCLTFHKARFVS